MLRKHVIIKEDELKDFIIKNFKEEALVEISYNRVFVPGKILFVDEDASITLQLQGNLLNQRVDINIDEVKNEIIEITYTYGDELIIIIITD